MIRTDTNISLLSVMTGIITMAPLHQVSILRLTPDCFTGRISNDDFDLIIGCVKESPRIPVSELREFRIVE